MTKAENRAAAKAYQEEKQRRWREEADAAAVAADLEQLAALRKYLIFDRKADISADSLIKAIDDYAADRRSARAARPASQHRRIALKLTNERPLAQPDKAARHIIEIANTIEPDQGRIHIEKINGPFLFRDKGTPANTALASNALSRTAG